jgi:hypothetical protein
VIRSIAQPVYGLKASLYHTGKLKLTAADIRAGRTKVDQGGIIRSGT